MIEMFLLVPIEANKKHVSFYRDRSTESYRMLIFRVNIAEDSAKEGAESQGCRSAGMGGREMKRGEGDERAEPEARVCRNGNVNNKSLHNL